MNRSCKQKKRARINCTKESMKKDIDNSVALFVTWEYSNSSKYIDTVCITPS